LLLSAAPDATADEKHMMIEDEEEVPESLAESAGCSFHQKCPLNESRCRGAEHEFIKAGENHFVRCWKVAENGEAIF
jgi:oligopeptide/dipeptide ABC transporter ATP-binding protein